MSSKNKTGSLQTTIHNAVATVQFGHPASNSFPRDLLNRLTSEINSLSTHSDVSVIVLQSEGDKVLLGRIASRRENRSRSACQV